MKKLLIYIFISITAYSTGQVINNFPRSENIKMYETVNPVPHRVLGRMFTTDDYLVIFPCNRMEENFFKYYSLDDLRFVLAGGQYEPGYDNMNNRRPDALTRISYYYFTPEGNRFTMIDNQTFKQIDIAEGKVNIINKDAINTPMNMPAVNNYSKIDDNVYCLTNTDITRPYEFILFDKQGENPKWISPYPKWANVKEELPLFTYISVVVPNPALKRFMVLYGKFRRLRLFDSKGNMLKDISVEFPFKFPPYDENNQSIMLSYSIPYADDKYVYAICYNARSNVTNKSTELQIWNWNAEPVAVLHLDKGLRQFAISEKKRRLYATDPLNADEKIRGKIFWCDLPKWLYEK